jgi:hypothetical protein
MSVLDAKEMHAARVFSWPQERDELLEARRHGVRRLVLVDPGVTPPGGSDLSEDWVRLPATQEDIRLRLESLQQRPIARNEQPPTLDAAGLLRFGTSMAVLTPIEQRLAELLIARYRMVVTRSELFRAGWSEEKPNQNALDVHLVRLRRRLDEVGLHLRTVRQRGYVLDEDRRGRFEHSSIA